MYFKEKENTNIDSEFKNSKNGGNKGGGSSFDTEKLKPLLLIGIALIVVVLVIVIATSSSGNGGTYNLELLGDETVTISQGEDYIEPGYKATKGKKDVTNLVKVVTTVDSSEAGEYTILYSINRGSLFSSSITSNAIIW